MINDWSIVSRHGKIGPALSVSLSLCLSLSLGVCLSVANLKS